jgi:predicted O-methyltransferase YrrM
MRPLPHFLLWSIGLVGPATQTTAAERACLAGYARGKRRLAEIGVWHGVTTCILRGAMAPDGVLYAVDPYPVGRLGVSLQQPIAHREVGRIRRGGVVWLRMTGADAARHLTSWGAAPIDFVFIDGDHSYEGLCADWTGWSPLVAPGGIVALHDSRPCPGRPIEGVGSVKYTAEVISLAPGFQVVDGVESLTVLRRRPTP